MTNLNKEARAGRCSRVNEDLRLKHHQNRRMEHEEDMVVDDFIRAKKEMDERLAAQEPLHKGASMKEKSVSYINGYYMGYMSKEAAAMPGAPQQPIPGMQTVPQQPQPPSPQEQAQMQAEQLNAEADEINAQNDVASAEINKQKAEAKAAELEEKKRELAEVGAQQQNLTAAMPPERAQA
jgi:hypothetical protein